MKYKCMSLANSWTSRSLECLETRLQVRSQKRPSWKDMSSLEKRSSWKDMSSREKFASLLHLEIAGTWEQGGDMTRGHTPIMKVMRDNGSVNDLKAMKIEKSGRSLKRFRIEATGPPMWPEIRAKGGGDQDTPWFPGGLLNWCVTFHHRREEEEEAQGLRRTQLSWN